MPLFSVLLYNQIKKQQKQILSSSLNQMLSKYLRSRINPQQCLQQTEFSSIDLSLLQIKIIDNIKPKYKFISQLYIDHNELISLNGIQQFQNLQVFSFNFNYISNCKELLKIKNKFFVKNIAFLGNPLQNQPMANIDGLREVGFVGLIKVNQLEARKINVHKFRNRNPKIPNKQVEPQNQQPYQTHTQRYPQKYNDHSPHHHHHHIETEYFVKNVQKQFSRTQPRLQISEKWKTNISTTLNKSNQLLRNENNGRNWSKQSQQLKQQRYEIKVQQEGVQIRPFHDVDEEEKGNEEGYHFDGKQMSLDGQSRDDIQQQSPIKNQEPDRQHSKSAHFQPQPPSNPPQKLPQPQSLAIQFLQQQKQQISQAFRKRCIKQKIFNFLLKNKQQNNRANIVQKRKAWAAIKIYHTLQLKV